MRKSISHSILKTMTVVLSVAGLVAAAPAGATGPRNVAGKTWGEWSALWWQWAFDTGFVSGPPFQTGPSVDCAFGQSGDVWYLAGTGSPTGGIVERTCSTPIPAGKNLFFPLINVVIFNPDDWCKTLGPDSICTVPEKRLLNDALFSDQVAGPVDSRACKISALLDGKPVVYRGIPLVRVQSPPFALNGDPQAVSDGFWVMLPPLSSGPHTVSLTGGVCEWQGTGEIFTAGANYSFVVD
jgi:hypothetical protein